MKLNNTLTDRINYILLPVYFEFNLLMFAKKLP